MRSSWIACSFVVAAVACSSAEVCDVAPAVETCTPAYEPTYANVFAKTLAPTCAKSGVSCHAEGAQGGLSFLDEASAYGMLVDARAVVPGGVACSTLVARLEAPDGKTRMPPGRALPEGEICAIRRWIADGAKK